MKKEIANYQVSLKAILKNENWEVLILKTPDNSSFLGYYDFPWWRIDSDEFEVNYLDILKREILEETGITEVQLKNEVVAIWRHKHKQDKIFYIVFEWKINSYDINVSFEHSWFNFIDLERIKLEEYFCSWMLDVAKMYMENK